MTLWGRRVLADWWDLNEDGRMAAAAGKSCRERFDSLHDPGAAWRESRVEGRKQAEFELKFCVLMKGF
jgi:hypothetical protein